MRFRIWSQYTLETGCGPKFASQATRSWLEKVGVTPIRIFPGSP